MHGGRVRHTDCLVGQNLGTITKSCSNGDVTAPDATSVGGLVGDSSGDIYDSYATGQVQGHGTVGGFAGSSSGKVERGYNLGAVQGAEYTGSFAGSIYHADTAVGAGRVTIISGSLTGYNGGFAGSLSGQLTGLANQVTIQTVYGNCIQDGAALNAVGNSSKFQSEAQKELLQQMTLTTLEEVSQRLYTLFGVNLPVPDTLKQEADKYLDQLTAGLNAQPGDSLSLLKEGQSAASGITVNYQTDSSYLTGGSQLIIAKLNDTALTQQLPVTLVLTDENGNVYRKNLSIVLPVTKDQQQSLMDAIAATLADSSDSWAVMDMAVYSSLENKTLKTTQKAYQNALNLLITTASKSDAYLSDRTRVELVLRAMGIDSRKLYPVNSNTAIDNAAALQNTDLTAGGHYAAPWVLLAQLQGNVELSEAQVDAMITLLKDNMAGGLFDSPWGPDPDTAGVALAALARYYDANSSAKDVVDTILAALPGALSETGSLGSANSDAMVILGLLALGRDPADLRAPSGASLIDGLLSYVNPQTNCFQYAGMDNALATEQGFRALVALAKFDGTPYQFYDFSANAVQPGRATGAGEVDPIPEPDTDKTIEVFFTLKTDSEVWVPQSSVTVKEGSTVYHAFVKAMDAQSDMSYVGAEAGYVKSITKAGVTLSEFDKGEHSGWLYKVNGTLPTVGITSYAIEDGDSIVFYYTYDWTKDPDAGGSLTNTASAKDQKAAAVVVDLIDKIGQVSSSSGPAIQAARAAYDKLTGVQQALVTNYAALIAAEKAFAKLTGELPFADVSGHWALEAIAYVYQNDLMNGTSSNRFTPDGTLSRAMAVTALYRLAGSPSVSGATAFQDVAPDSWYHDAVVWASQNGIAKGLDATTFAPDRSITREQIAALLQRYCQQQGHDTGKVIDLSGFWDAPSVSAWAQEAMTWAVAEGLITGRAGDRLAAAETATRAEAAVILMRLAQQLTAQ